MVSHAKDQRGQQLTCHHLGFELGVLPRKQVELEGHFPAMAHHPRRPVDRGVLMWARQSERSKASYALCDPTQNQINVPSFSTPTARQSRSTRAE